jgi:hypothetical protein
MKKLSNYFIMLLFFSFITLSLKAQTKCGSNVDIEQIRLNNPSAYQRILDFNRKVADYKNALSTRGAEDIIVIPVVVHVVYNTSVQNISDALIHSQIAVLNEDFNRLNADAVNTPSDFSGVASNPKFRFRLACIDPSGNPTTGIERRYTRVESFSTLNNPKQIQSSAGDNQYVGIDPWPANKYLNIWVCNVEAGPNQLNTAYIPSYELNNHLDGVIIHYEVFGRSNSLPSNGKKLGRVGTHEVAHWLDCYHVFQGGCNHDPNDPNTDYNRGDLCKDTPRQTNKNFDCPIYPKVSCSGQPNGDMFMNFMDYTNDECMNLFTVDQKNRMRALFEPGGFRRSIIENNSALNQVTRNYVPQNGSNVIILKKTAQGSNDIGSTSLTYTPIYVDDCKKTGDISWRLIQRNSEADVIISGESASVRLTRSNATCELEVTIPTSTGNIIENYSFYVYVPSPHYDLSPNPTTDVFRIEQRLNPNDVQLLETDYDVTIYNTANAPVKKGKGNKGKVTFDLSNQPRGLYQVIIETQGRLISKRVMVQR